MAQAIIFGAGKIARGFIGQLLWLSGVDFAFVEKSAELVSALRSRGGYTVNVLGAPEKNTFVTGYRAYTCEESEAIARETAQAQLFFTAVGGKNLEAIAPVIGQALCSAPRPINLITCENWKSPADVLQRLIGTQQDISGVGFAESVVMRSAIEPDAAQLDADPLTVNVQDFWKLPIDADHLAAPLPAVQGLEPIPHFQGYLERKFYTYNAANGTVSFLGALLGHQIISEAAMDKRITPILEMVYLETGRALSQKYGISLDEQLAFADTSRQKLRNRVIVDKIERNARDPLRKLGPDDRLVGSARLAMEHGVEPVGLATAIAAAIHYRSPGDPSAEELERLLQAHGTGYILKNICKREKGDSLYALVLEREGWLKEMGWLK